MTAPTRTRNVGARVVARVYIAAILAGLAVLSWLQAEKVVDDRGSDSTEKAQNIIWAVAAGAIVAGAGTALVTKLTGKW